MNIMQSDIFERALPLIRRAYNKADSKIEVVSVDKKKKLLLWGLIVLVCFSALLLLNVLTPLISDDFAYLFIYGEDVRITSLRDIVQSQINHYYMWGGRSVVHFIDQVLLLLPARITDILNSLVFLGYIFLIYYHIKGKEGKKGSVSLFILINLSIWFLQPVFGDTILWITGAANYLWGTFLILLFLLPYRFYKGEGLKLRYNVCASIVLFLFGIIAGWTNENTAGAMILIAILFLFYYRSHLWEIPIWALSGIVGAIIGYALMIMAPGNLVRAGDATSLSLFIIAYRLFNCTLTFFYYCGPLILICLLMFVGFHHYNKGNKHDNIKLGFIYAIAALAAVYAMLLSPTFPRRALFGVVTYLIITAGIWLYNLNFQYSFIRQINYSIILIGLFSFLFSFYLAVKEINTFRKITEDREIVINAAKEQGFDSCEFERYVGGSYIHGEDPFSEELMTRYYGIRVKLKNPD